MTTTRKSIPNKLSASLGSAGGDISDLLRQLDKSVDGIRELTDSVTSDLAATQNALGDSGALLDRASSKVSGMIHKAGADAAER